MTKTSTRRPAAALRRSLLENLEGRQLMATTSGAINFQPGGPGTPAGMTADYGSAFGWQFGKQYGFSSNNRSNAVERQTSADVEHDTFIKLGSGAASKWEIAVDNGTYSVQIVAGDASAYDGKYVINAENTTVVNGTPTSGSRWVSGAANVTVTDGRLTLTPGSGASNVKLNSVRFNKVSSNAPTPTKPTTPTAPTTPTTPAKPAPTPAKPTTPAPTPSGKATSPGTLNASAASSTSVKLSWSNPANESGVTVERSTDGAKWTDVAWYGPDATSHTDSNLTAGKTYYFRVRAWNPSGFARSTVAKVSLASSTPTTPAKPTTPTVTKPANPSGTATSLTSKNAVKVSWGNVSGETGFIVERSTNNSTWTEAVRVGADTTSATISNLSYNTTYYFRVKAFNTAGTSGASNTATIKTQTQTATGAGDQGDDQTPAPTPNPGINSFAMSGIVQNEAEFGMANKAMKELGIKSVRLWYSVNSWTDGVNNWALNKAIEYKKAGYTVTLAVVGKQVSDYNTAKAYYQRLVNAPNAKGAVDYWEIGNEPNHTPYWNGSLQQFVQQQQKPAYEVLKAAGEKVIGGGVTWDVNALKQMISYGYLDYCDYAGFHAYGETGKMVAERAAAAKAAVGNKPLIITEWNVRLVSDLNQWAKELDVAAKTLSQVAYLNYYYALEVDTAVKSTGRGGVVHSNGAKNTPIWNTVYNWIN